MNEQNASITNDSEIEYGSSRDIRRELQELIVRCELSQDASAHRYEIMKKNRAAQAQALDDRLHNIMGEVEQFRRLTSRYGLAEIHTETEHVLAEGKSALKSLHTTTMLAKNQVNEACEKLNHTSVDIMKKVVDAMAAIRNNNIKQFTEKRVEELGMDAKNYDQKMSAILHQFHWKNLAMAAFLTLVVAFLMSLYIDDQWPWEMREQIVKERNAGRALINAWSQISQSDQQVIANSV